VGQEQVEASAGVEEAEAEWAAIALEPDPAGNVFAPVAGAECLTKQEHPVIT